MKAVRITTFGGPDVLTFDDQPMPEVGANDVLVKVMATAVSGWDIKYRKGYLHRNHGDGLTGRPRFPMPMQLGREAAGIVEAVGAGVTGFAPGDRVVGLVHPENPRSPEAIRGLGNLSSGISYPGHTMFGGYAQFVARPVDYWLPLPSAVSFDQAASAMWAAATAHRIVIARLEVSVGDTILVTGAAGGMGVATMQIARLAGARVIATTRDMKRSEFLTRWGAANVLDSGGSSARADIRALTKGQGVDGAVEFTGAASVMELCRDSMRLGGTLCPVGGEREPLPLSVWDLVNLELNVKGVRGSTLRDQHMVLQLLESGQLDMPIACRLPLSSIAEAHALQESGTADGRIIIHPWA